MAPQDWKPDDTFHDIIDGQFKGVLRVRSALEKHGITIGSEIITSRDPGLQPLWQELRRDTMPQGFDQWQLPIILGGGDRPVMSFITFGTPHAVVPEHRHRDDCLFRIVLAGSIFYKDIELTMGDWMYVPTGMSYSFKAGRIGCVIMHLYNGSGLHPSIRSARRIG
jgi:hypothetical protein